MAQHPRDRERDGRVGDAARCAPQPCDASRRLRHRDRAHQRAERRATSSTRTRVGLRRAAGSRGRCELLREAGIAAHGLRRRERAGPGRAKDALAQLEPSIDRDHRLDASGGEVGLDAPRRRRGDPRGRGRHRGRARRRARRDGAEKNVLVVANETVVGDELLARIRRRHEKGAGELPHRCAAERRARRAPRGRAAAETRARVAARRGHRRPRPGRAPGPVHGRDARDRATSGSTRSSSRRSPVRSPGGCAATWSRGSAVRRGCPSTT